MSSAGISKCTTLSMACWVCRKSIRTQEFSLARAKSKVVNAGGAAVVVGVDEAEEVGTVGREFGAEERVGGSLSVVAGGNDVGFVVVEGEDGIEGRPVPGGEDFGDDFGASLGVKAEDVDVFGFADRALNGFAELDRLGLTEAAVRFFFGDQRVCGQNDQAVRSAFAVG